MRAVSGYAVDASRATVGSLVAGVELLRRGVPFAVTSDASSPASVLSGSLSSPSSLSPADISALDAWRDLPRRKRGFLHDLLARIHSRGPYKSAQDETKPYLPDGPPPPPLGSLHADLIASSAPLDTPAPLLADALVDYLASRWGGAALAAKKGVDSEKGAHLALTPLPDRLVADLPVADASRLGWALGLEARGWLSGAGAEAVLDDAAEAARASLPPVPLWGKKRTLADLLVARPGFSLLLAGNVTGASELANQVHAALARSPNPGLDVIVASDEPLRRLRPHLTQILDTHAALPAALAQLAPSGQDGDPAFALVAPNGAVHAIGSLQESSLESLESLLESYFSL